ncbi:hypothetical protein Tsubulata_034942 [Turnera subulata]|uniref:DUF4283 domain-containing protein n=1 Tax=Turnera subulata TaxID=218843 RepID=A0A9Q0J9T5_9ROSI|nr:hypothetical protein Tsubulata_034942 [Turnera subulata]
MESVQYVWKLHDRSDVKVSELSGNTVLACFPSEASMRQFIQEAPDWVRIWFSSLKPWEKGDHAKNRRAWLCIRGIPLHAWCNEFFQIVGSLFGDLVRVDPATEQRHRLDGAWIEVLTSQGGTIEKDLEVVIADGRYSISVVEFQGLTDDCTADSGRNSLVPEV